MCASLSHFVVFRTLANVTACAEVGAFLHTRFSIVTLERWVEKPISFSQREFNGSARSEAGSWRFLEVEVREPKQQAAALRQDVLTFGECRALRRRL
jgi:hypothetical protein